MNSEFNRLVECVDSERNTKCVRSVRLALELFNRITLKGCGGADDLGQLMRLSVVMSSYPKRIIRKGTSRQSGVKFDASIMSLLDSTVVAFGNVQIKAFMCDFNETTSSLARTEITTTSTVEHSLMGHRDLWTIKNMKYEPEGGARSSRRSTCEKKIIQFQFSADCHTLSTATAAASPSRRIVAELFSDSVVVISHSNQEIDCHVTLFWDDFYRASDGAGDDRFARFRFPCHDSASADDLVDHLAQFFAKETGRALTTRNRAYLLQKIREIYRGSNIISFADFLKRPLPATKLSFGQWIMSIMKMLKIPTLESLWRKNFIEGFISKDVGLILPLPGYFLLRFSERQPAIGVVLKSDNGTTEAWDPYLESFLRVNNLANLLDEYPILTSIVTTNNDVIDRRVALEPFMDNIPIDDGYTRRGGDGGERCLVLSVSDGTSVAEMEIFDSIGSFSVPESVAESEDNYDLDEIFDGCNNLLRLL